MSHKIMNRVFLVLLVAGLCALPASAVIVEEIIAKVNDHPILLSEYKHNLDILRQELSQNEKGLDLEAAFNEQAKNVLRDLIDRQLLVQKAADLGIKVDADVVKRLDSIRRQMKLPSMEALEQAVEKQGMNYADFKENIRENILTQQVISREVGSRIEVTPAAIKAYYDKHKQELARPEGVHIQQILISTEGKPAAQIPALRKKAEEVLAKARKSGQNFGELAKEYSDDPTAANGGDAGFFQRGDMASEVESVAYSLKKDQISNIIRTKYGFLIIKLLEHTRAGVPTLAEAETAIHERLYYQKIQPALRKYLTKLRQDSYISIKPGFTDTGAAPSQQASARKP